MQEGINKETGEAEERERKQSGLVIQTDKARFSFAIRASWERASFLLTRRGVERGRKGSKGVKENNIKGVWREDKIHDRLSR